MAETGVETNIVEVNARLASLDRAMRGQALETAVRAGLLPIETLAKAVVHKVTGNLARSIHTEVQSSGDAAAGRTGTNVEYALAEEFRPGDHAYLRPAYDRGKEDAVDEVAAALRIVVRKSAQ